MRGNLYCFSVIALVSIILKIDGVTDFIAIKCVQFEMDKIGGRFY